MKRFILPLALLLGCARGEPLDNDTTRQEAYVARPTVYPTWATNTNYAGGPAPWIGTPTKIAPSAGQIADGWRSQDIPPAQEQNYEMNLIDAWIEWLDNGSVATTAALAALTSIPDGTRVHVRSVGVSYDRVAAGSGQTADGYWLITSADGGQFIHPNWNDAVTQKVANVGPIPGEAVATPAGRVPRSVVPFGLFIGTTIGTNQFTTTDATNVSATTGHVFETVTLGTLLTADYVTLQLNSIALNSTGNFQIGVYISFDNGSTWTIASPDTGGGSANTFLQTAAGVQVPTPLDFTFPAPSGGICKIQFKGSAPGGGTTQWTRGPGFLAAHRF